MGKMKNIQITIEELRENGINTTLEELIKISQKENIPMNEVPNYLIQNKKQGITM